MGYLSWKSIKNKCVSAWNKLSNHINESNKVIEDLHNIVQNNVSAHIGICLGMGLETEIGGVGIEAMTRMDIIGIGVDSGEIKVGHFGHSGASLTFLNITGGKSYDTYESFGLNKREVSKMEGYIDYSMGISSGQAFLIGYHYNVSISFLGMYEDFIDYFGG